MFWSEQFDQKDKLRCCWQSIIRVPLLLRWVVMAVAGALPSVWDALPPGLPRLAYLGLRISTVTWDRASLSPVYHITLVSFHVSPTLFIYFLLKNFFLFLFFLLYNIILVLPYIHMNPPQVYTCSPSWTPFPPPSLYHPSQSSHCTSPKHPVSCIEPGLTIWFIYDIIHVSMPFSQIIPPSPSPTESKSLFFTSVSLLLSHI